MYKRQVTGRKDPEKLRLKKWKIHVFRSMISGKKNLYFGDMKSAEKNLFFELREKIAKSIENKGFHEILNKKF